MLEEIITFGILLLVTSQFIFISFLPLMCISTQIKPRGKSFRTSHRTFHSVHNNVNSCDSPNIKHIFTYSFIRKCLNGVLPLIKTYVYNILFTYCLKNRQSVDRQSDRWRHILTTLIDDTIFNVIEMILKNSQARI